MFDTASINRAVERAIKDAKFLNDALESIKLMKFPAYKNRYNTLFKKYNQ